MFTIHKGQPSRDRINITLVTHVYLWTEMIQLQSLILQHYQPMTCLHHASQRRTHISIVVAVFDRSYLHDWRRATCLSITPWYENITNSKDVLKRTPDIILQCSKLSRKLFSIIQTETREYQENTARNVTIDRYAHCGQLQCQVVMHSLSNRLRNRRMYCSTVLSWPKTIVLRQESIYRGKKKDLQHK